MVQAVFPPAALLSITAPLTLKLALIIRVADAPLKVIDAQEASDATVQIAPFEMIASFPDPGTPALHLAASVQLPVPEKVVCPNDIIE